ncbi:MAG: tetratricopeptide repeat protein, partial [Xanthomonadales bacterium]|nr:tetratricopeptide repeat protein [Xanthomonadales bacterium]
MVEQPVTSANDMVDTGANEAECRARLFTDPEDVQAMRRLGWLCGQHGRIEEGRDWLERALALQPQSTNLELPAAALAAAAGDDEEAESAFRKILAHSPNTSAAQTGLGHIAQGRQQWQAAENYFRAALKLAPEALDALLGLGQSRLALGDTQQAARWFMRATQLYPQHPLALTRYAQALLTHGDAQAAARPLIRALEIDADFIEARRMLGHVELVRGRVEAAEAAFRSVLAKALSADAYAGLGHALRMQQRFAEAVNAYDHAIGAGESNEQIVTERAACMLRSGQANTAVADLLGYIETHKRCGLPRLLLARIYDQSDRADDALALWQAASSTDAQDALAQAELAQRLELSGDFAACKQALGNAAADQRVPTTLLRA